MEDDETLEPLPDLDGDHDEPSEPSADFGDGLAAELSEGADEVGLDAAAGGPEPDDPAGFLDPLPDDAGGLSDAAGPEQGLGDLLEDDEVEPPPLTGEDDEARWEDHSGLVEAPPLGADDGGELGLEEPHLGEDGLADDEVDLPSLDRDESGLPDDRSPPGQA